MTLNTSGSSYEKYEKTHGTYDRTRLAIGSGEIAQLLREKFRDKQPRILDAGCGTGILLQDLQDAGFTSLTGIDASQTGLSIAREKLGESVNLVRGDIRAMPFSAGSFDAVIFSFVVHHLPHTGEAELQTATQAVLEDTLKLLAPGGQLILVTCTREQMSPATGCMWYYKYFPEAAEELSQRFLPSEKLVTIAAQSGLLSARYVEVQKVYWTEAGLEPTGPFDKAWRGGDSLFALCEKDPVRFEKELQALQAEIDSGAVVTHISAVKARVETLKQAVLLFAEKPAA